MKYIIVLILALSGFSAHAVTYYICDCQSGADGACVAGSNANSVAQAQNPATPWQTWAGVPAANKTAATYAWCRGGKWTNVTIGFGWFTGGVSRTSESNPAIFEPYTPSWCTGACLTTKPHLYNNTAGAYMMNMNDGSNLMDGGYIIRDLKLDGGGMPGAAPVMGAAAGVFTYWTVKGVLLENLEIRGFQRGLHINNSTTLPTSNVVLRNSTLYENLAASILGGANNLLVENNVFTDNGSPDANPDDHDIYLSNVSNGTVRNNTISDTTIDASTGKCAKTVVVVHGLVDGLTIEGNTITQPGSRSTCYGIEADQGYSTAEYMRRVIIRDNLIVNVGYVGIAVRSCTDCIIESNRIVSTSADAACYMGISLAGNAPGAGDALNARIAVRNNSIYMDCYAGSGGEIRAIDVPFEGTGHVVTNNLIYIGPNASPNVARTCFTLATNTLANFTAFANNLCYYASGTPTWSNLYSTLANAQAAGWDTGSLNANPLLAATPAVGNSYSMAVSVGSPAINAGNTTHKSRLAVGRTVPIGARDIGAHDYTASVVSPYPPLTFR